MSEEVQDEDEPPKKASKLPLIIGLVLALCGAGGGFYATWSGLILGPKTEEVAEEPAAKDDKLNDIAFLELDPLVVAIDLDERLSHLRFRAQLEVQKEHLAEVELLKPRIVDVFNGYLRAVKTSDLMEPTSLVRIRGHLLRRIQVILGPGRVNDLLVMEFVIN